MSPNEMFKVTINDNVFYLWEDCNDIPAVLKKALMAAGEVNNRIITIESLGGDFVN